MRRIIKFSRIALTLLPLIFAVNVNAQDRQWRVTYVSPVVWHNSPEAAAYAYADWYCSLPAAQSQYNNCTPDYLNAGTYPTFYTRLRLTKISNGSTVYTGGVAIGSRIDPNQPPPPAQAKQLGCDGKCNASGDGVVGNPINAGTGNKYQAELDFSSSGPNSIRFERFYNSKSLDEGSLGPRWNHTYGRSIEFRKTSATNWVARVRRPTGRIYSFTQSAGAWVADADVSATLSWNSTALGLPLSWTFRDLNDSVEMFDGAGRLQSITSRSGTSQTVEYDSQSRISEVADTFGHQLTFGYDAQNRLVSITTPESTAIQFAYTASGMLGSVTYPNSTVRTYVYNESANTSGTNLPKALTGIIDESAVRFATFKFDSAERAVATLHAGGADQTTIAYLSTDVASVTDGLGTARTFNFTTSVGVQKLESIFGPVCTGCGFFSSYSYDASGNVASRQDANGNTTAFESDLTRNLQVSRTEALGTANSRTVSTTWHTTFRLPVSIAEPNRISTFTYDNSGNPLTRTIKDTSVSGIPPLLLTPS